jgi:hypothetical protein
MAQNDLVVVGIDVAKDKVDACIRRFALRQTFPRGHRKLVAWLRKHKVGKAAMEASGGYERDWAKYCARPASRCGLSIPSGFAASHCRPVDWPRTIRSTRR